MVIFSFFLFYNLKRHLSDQNKINAIISERVEYVKKYHGVISRKTTIGCNCIVKLKSDNTIRFPWADNLSVKPKHLCEFLAIGDSIHKTAYSDSLIIYRKSKEYQFVLRKRIWR